MILLNSISKYLCRITFVLICLRALFFFCKVFPRVDCAGNYSFWRLVFSEKFVVKFCVQTIHRKVSIVRNTHLIHKKTRSCKLWTFLISWLKLSFFLKTQKLPFLVEVCRILHHLKR